MNNKGDTICLELDYLVDGEPIQEGDWDDIEFCIGSKRFLLSEQDIFWDDNIKTYCVQLSQSDTFALGNIVKYQIRLKKDGEVVSSKTKQFALGSTISQEVI